MLYPKNQAEQLSTELFRNPTSEYRSVPFWAWNCKVTKEKIDQNLEAFHAMGFGGVDIHPRVGLDTAYLSDEFHALVRYAVEKCKSLGMYCWLYDDDRYPSGSADGLVTKDDHYRGRWLVLTEKPRIQADGYAADAAAFEAELQAGRSPAGYFAAAYSIRLQDGCLASYHRLADMAEAEACRKAGEAVRFAYVQLTNEGSAFGGEGYVDTMNPAAVRKFIEVSHESYARSVGDEFGKTIPSIFTDEPRIGRHNQLPWADSHADVTMPYTEAMAAAMQKRFGIDPLDIAPEYIWQLPGGQYSVNRYRYRDMIAECFARAFLDQIGDWCKAHNILLSGHVLCEDTLEEQTYAVGDCMRCYRNMDVPGMDLLLDKRKFNTAKQVASVARQNGREAVVSELYGVTHWDCTFPTFKLQGDWQAALGVTVRIPHLSHMSLGGEGKRDWPGSIFFHAPWYKEFHLLEDHFARLNTALTRGQPIVNIGVIHPVESMWLQMGPDDQTADLRKELDEDFTALTDWLLFGGLDFDFLSESLLPEQCRADACTLGAALQVGRMQYRTVLVPGLYTIRSTTLDRLEAFHRAGGRVIFMGRIPQLVDALPSDRASQLATQCLCLGKSRSELYAALESDRLLDIRCADGRRPDNLLYQLRRDNGAEWLFLCHAYNKKQNLAQGEAYTVRLKGHFSAELYDTATGAISALTVQQVRSDTLLDLTLFAHDSVLLRLRPGKAETVVPTEKGSVLSAAKLPLPESYSLQEPNVLLLDRAAWKLDDGAWHDPTEILHIDETIRRALGFATRGEHMYQPYMLAPCSEHRLVLRYTIQSEINTEARLALEELSRTEITLNGRPIASNVDGWYVDPAIQTIALPGICQGTNTLTLTVRFDQKTNLENLYLLGNFGVRLTGTLAALTAKPESLDYGDITRQGLPFYTGSYTMTFPLSIAENGAYSVHFPRFSAPLLAVQVDGGPRTTVAFAPYRAVLGTLCAGTHRLIVTVFGNRFNDFGTLHNADDAYVWYGPASFRTQGDDWTDCYRVRPVGLLAAPILEKIIN